MRAMVLTETKRPLELKEVATPKPGAHEALIRVQACGVCRTDVHLADGELKNPKLPLILGHQIVGAVEALGSDVKEVKVGERVGVPWLASSCQRCSYCKEGRENLCDLAVFTGYTKEGGFAEWTVADARYCIPLPAAPRATELAPLLCAGLIGYRAYRRAGSCKRIGLYGFGASAHLLAQLALCEGKEVYAFTKEGDAKRQAFARALGVTWAGGSEQEPPEKLDAALLFAPVGELMPRALAAVKKGGTVVCAGIHMSAIPSFPYSLLWEERTLTSVAHLTRADAVGFFKAIQKCSIKVQTTLFALEEANVALDAIRQGTLDGAVVLRVL